MVWIGGRRRAICVVRDRFTRHSPVSGTLDASSQEALTLLFRRLSQSMWHTQTLLVPKSRSPPAFVAQSTSRRDGKHVYWGLSLSIRYIMGTQDDSDAVLTSLQTLHHVRVWGYHRKGLIRPSQETGRRDIAIYGHIR
ncbi:hypothetical protein PM082_011600 [Marasmius tenuissimus]|nr:hypothetical protein PM082_011600 [Marasmius tenuissimus]